MKSAIIINPDLSSGLIANAIACITSGLFLEGKNLVGEKIEGRDVSYIPITKIPILILKPGQKSLVELCQQAQKLNLTYMAFTKEAQSTTNYAQYTERVAGKNLASVTLLGLGVVGENKEINSLVGSLPMLR